jgi:hypothetical protein
MDEQTLGYTISVYGKTLVNILNDEREKNNKIFFCHDLGAPQPYATVKANTYLLYCIERIVERLD